MNQSSTTDSTISGNQPELNKKKSWPTVLIWLILVLVLGAGLYFYFNNGNPGSQPATPLVQEAANIKTTSDANNYFGFNIFNDLSKSVETDNLFVSPMSLSMALSMVANGANGETLTEMKKVLGQSNLSLDLINSENQKLLTALRKEEMESYPTISEYKNGLEIASDPLPNFQSGDQPLFKIANSIWVDKKYSFLPEYVKLCQESYNAESRSLDFKDPNSLKTINDWVSKKTNSKIPQILDNLLSDMYLINAIYFKASWAEPFEVAATKDENFYLEDGSNKKVSQMNQSGSYKYYEEKDLQILSIPYLGGKYAMQVFLPSKGTKINDFVSTLSWDKYTELLSKQAYKEGEVTFPKFKIEYGQEMIKNLKNLGLNLATSPQADFSKMSADPMMISEVIHKTFINTDEKGTEAAAVTAIGMAATSAEPFAKPIPFKFIADHPFFFTIEDTQTHQIIFMGTVKNPAI